MRHWRYLVGLLLLCAACATSRQRGEGGLTADEQQRFDYIFLEAQRYKQLEAHDTAYEMIKQCLDIDPNAAAVLFELATLNVALGRWTLVLPQLEKAVALAPDNYWYKAVLASFYNYKGMTAEAIATYEEIVERFPKRTADLMTLASLYHSNKQYADEIAALDRLELKEGMSEMITVRKVAIYAELGEREKTYDEVTRLVNEYPNDLRYRVLLSDTYLLNDCNDEALPIIEGVLAEEADNADAQWSLATYYRNVGLDSLCVAQTERLLMNRKFDNEKRVQIMQREIAEQQQRGADSTRVMNLFAQLMAQEVDNADMSMLCVQYMMSKEMDQEAIEPVLRHVLEIEPDNATARYHLLRYVINNEDYAAAIDIALPALQYNPDVILFYFYLAAAYTAQGEYERTIEVALKGVAQMGDGQGDEVTSGMYLMAGDACHKLDRRDEAYGYYEKSIAFNPNNVAALNNYAYYLSVENRDLDKAEEMSYRTVKAEPQNATYLDTYAWILFMKGRYVEAKIYIDNAVKLDDEENVVLLEHCGDIHFMCDEVDEALTYWQKASAKEHESKTLEQKIKLRKYIAE